MKILRFVLPIVVILISSYGFAQEQSKGGQTTGAKQDVALSAPDLADIIPLAATLSSRLTALENKTTGLLDISEVGSKFAVIEANLNDPAGQLQRLKESKDYKSKKLVTLREAIEQINESFEEINMPLSNAIRQLGSWRREWLAAKKRWNELQSSLREEGAFDQLDATFENGNDTIAQL